MRDHEVWHDWDITSQVISHLENNPHEVQVRKLYKEWCIEVFSPQASVLEVGCGPGLVGAELSPHFPYTGIDNSQHMLDYAKRTQQHLNIQYGDAYDLPFPDKSFDNALCLQVLGHLPADTIRKPIAELCRVARNCVLFTSWTQDAKDIGNAIHNGYSADFLEKQLPAGAILHLDKQFGDTTLGYRIDCRACDT